MYIYRCNTYLFRVFFASNLSHKIHAQLAYSYIYIYRYICNLTKGPRRLSAIFLNGTVEDLCCAAALCVEPQRSLCRAPTFSVSGPGALSLSLSLFVLCPGALCRAPVLSVSSALYLGPRRSVSGLPRSSLCGALCVKARRSLCRDPAVFSLSGPAALCVGAGALCVRHCPAPGSLRRARPISQVCVKPAAVGVISVSRPGALFVGPTALCCRAALSVSGPAVSCSLCRDLYRARRSVLSVSGTLCVGPGACQGPAVSGSGPRALPRSLCRGPALFASLSVLGRGAPTLSASGPAALSSVSGPALSVGRPLAETTASAGMDEAIELRHCSGGLHRGPTWSGRFRKGRLNTFFGTSPANRSWGLARGTRVGAGSDSWHADPSWDLADETHRSELGACGAG